MSIKILIIEIIDAIFRKFSRAITHLIKLFIIASKIKWLVLGKKLRESRYILESKAHRKLVYCIKIKMRLFKGQLNLLKILR